MREKKIKKTAAAMDYLGYALYAFGGLGMEILLMILEVNIYGSSSNAWSAAQHIIHWMITCLIWGIIGRLLWKRLPADPEKGLTPVNWIMGIIIIVV